MMYVLEIYGHILTYVTDRRKNGRSYLGVIDEVQSSMSAVDIPFTYLTNIVCLILTFIFHYNALKVYLATLSRKKQTNLTFGLYIIEVFWPKGDVKLHVFFVSYDLWIDFREPFSIHRGSICNPPNVISKGAPAHFCIFLLDLFLVRYAEKSWFMFLLL